MQGGGTHVLDSPTLQRRLAAVQANAELRMGSLQQRLLLGPGTPGGISLAQAKTYGAQALRGLVRTAGQMGAAESMGDQPVRRGMTAFELHCLTCPSKTGLYLNLAECIAKCGGWPGDGSDQCHGNCLCYIRPASITSVYGDDMSQSLKVRLAKLPVFDLALPRGSSGGAGPPARSLSPDRARMRLQRLGITDTNLISRNPISGAVRLFIVEGMERLASEGIPLPSRIEIRHGKPIEPERANAIGSTSYADDQETLVVWIEHSFWRYPEWQTVQAHADGQISTDDVHYVFFHEAGHVAHHRAGVPRLSQLAVLTPDEDAVAAKVSNRAKLKRGEFMSEVYAALATGRELPDDVLRLYREKGGIDPR